MDELARGAAGDRAAVFRTAAAERGLPPQYVEKDFWACWILRRVFVPPLVPGMVFKGGTSLSKVWDAVERFSEDLDLTLPRKAVAGAEKIEIRDDQGSTQRKRLKGELDGLLRHWCSRPGLEALTARVEAVLGGREGWTVAAEADSLEFEYPPGLPRDEYGGGYVRRLVRLEFGLVMPTEPAEDRSVHPYCARAGAYVMADPATPVRALAAERTFWEKATLVHAENHRDEPRETADRLSRHYADLATLFEHEIGERALERIALLPQVAREKSRYFHAGWARYEEAERGRLQLIPPPKHERALRRDYEAMREMYFGEPLSFEEILRRLGDLQAAVARHPMFQERE